MTSVESQVSSDFYKILTRAEINTVLKVIKYFKNHLGICEIKVAFVISIENTYWYMVYG